MLTRTAARRRRGQGLIAARNSLRGHPLIWLEDRWVYEDDHADLPSRGGKIPPCKKCGELFPQGELDPCLGTLPGVQSACCGHGLRSGSYVHFTTGVVLEGFTVKAGWPTDQGDNMTKRILWALLRLPVVLLCLIIHPLDEELARDLRKWAGLDW